MPGDDGSLFEPIRGGGWRVPASNPQPGFVPVSTSYLAAQRVRRTGQQSRQQTLILNFLHSCGRAGATREQIIAATGMKSPSATGRCSELLQSRKLRDSGRREKSSSGVAVQVLVHEDFYEHPLGMEATR